MTNFMPVVLHGLSAAWAFIGDSKEQLLTIGTIALAIATYALFRKTASMADATRAMAEGTTNAGYLADKHHQQSLSGLVVLSGGRVEISLPIDSNGSEVPTLGLTGRLENVGFGPALDIVLWVIHKRQPAHLDRTRIGAMGIGQSHQLEKLAIPPSIHFPELAIPRTDISVSTKPVYFEELRRETERRANDFGNELGTYVTVLLQWTNIFGGKQQAEYFVSSSRSRLENRSELEIFRRGIPTSADSLEVRLKDITEPEGLPHID